MKQPTAASEEYDKSPEQRRSRWITIWVMLLGLLVGTLLAIGHHVFYSSLAGTYAPNDAYHLGRSWSISKQEVNLAVGTIFAFLVKAALGIPLSAAYTQLFWQTVRRPSRTLTLSVLDTAFSALSSPSAFFKLHVWRHVPQLFGLAVLYWVIPLASVLPPATLSVNLAPIQPPKVSLINVPCLDFASLNYVSVPDYQPYDSSDLGSGPVAVQSNAHPVSMSPNVGPEYVSSNMTHSVNPMSANVTAHALFDYNGPSQSVSSVADTVGSRGSLLPIEPPISNTSWQIEFSGPALACNHTTSSLQHRIKSNIARAMTDSHVESCGELGFLAWTSGLGSSRDQSCGHQPPMPFVRFDTFQSGISGWQFSPSCWDTSNRTPAILYMAFFENTTSQMINDCQLTAQSFPNSTSSIIQCELRNATYTTSFSYPGGIQQVNVTRAQMDNGPLLAVNQIIYGNATPESIPCNYVDLVESPAACASPQQLLRSLSYQAVMEAFSNLFLGSISNFADSSNLTAGSSDILSTVLANRADLNYLKYVNWNSLGNNNSAFGDTIVFANQSKIPGLSQSGSPEPSLSLTQSLEELFQQVVISMMSDDQLKPNLSSPFAPPPVNVTFHDYQDVYSYSAIKLWISYGIGIGFTVAASIAGILALAANGGSYGLHFSTVLRVTHGADISVDIAADDADGKDPLPKSLRQATVDFSLANLGTTQSTLDDEKYSKNKVQVTASARALLRNR